MNKEITIPLMQQELIDAVLETESRESINKLLKALCEAVAADGCVLWRGSINAAPPERGWLTMLASWFDGISKSFPRKRILELSKTVEGEVAAELPGHIELNKNFVHSNHPFYAEDPFYEANGLVHSMVMRFEYARSRRIGVVTFYRKAGKPFATKDQETLEAMRMHEWLPKLYRTARDRMAFKLVSDVAEVLREKQKEHAEAHDAPENQAQIEHATIEAIGAMVAEVFRGLETSIFMDLESDAGNYVHRWIHNEDAIHQVVDIREQSYRASTKHGFSGYVLMSGETVHVYDTQDCSREEKMICQSSPRYSDFAGHSQNAKKAAAKANTYLQMDPESPPPHSLVIAPIQDGRRMLGFIRCWVAMDNPNYYSQDDEDLLRIIALNFGRVLGEWRNQRIERLRAKDVSELTSRPGWNNMAYRFAPKMGHSTDMLTRDVLQVILELVDHLVPGSDVNTVRLLDKESDEFFFFLLPKAANFEGGFTEDFLKHLRLPRRGKSMAARVCDEGADTGEWQPKRYTNLVPGKDGYTEFFKGVRHMIIAPIVVKGELIGVLDIRSKSDELLEPAALEWTKVIVFMMSLLIDRQHEQAARKAFEAETAKQAAKKQREMREAFEDVSHQMKSPIAEARNRVAMWVERKPFSVTSSEAHLMKSLLERALFTTHLISLFAQITSGMKLTPSRGRIDPTVVDEVIYEARYGATLRLHPSRNIRIQVDDDNLHKHLRGSLKMEKNMLFQAVNNIVDNAAKYSHRNTNVTISTGRSDKGRFYIAVKNRGIPVRPYDIPRMTQRGWRGDEAQLTVGEGNGLGLYIVKMIMELHGGSLDIISTNSVGVTEVRLSFQPEPES